MQEDGSSLVITLEDVTTAFRRELGAGRGRYSRCSTVQYSTAVQYSTVQQGGPAGGRHHPHLQDEEQQAQAQDRQDQQQGGRLKFKISILFLPHLIKFKLFLVSTSAVEDVCLVWRHAGDTSAEYKISTVLHWTVL